MWTSDDMLFCMLHNCESGLKMNKLNCCYYLYELAGFNFNLRYKLTAQGVECREVNEFLDLALSMNMVEVRDGVAYNTESGEDYYTEVVLFADKWEKIDSIRDLIIHLTSDEVYFIVLTDMVISDVKRKQGVDALLYSRCNIVRTLSSLSTEYSDENFESAIKIIRYIKGELESYK